MTTIDGGRAGAVVTFAGGEGEEAVLEGFTIRNGSGRLFELGHGYWASCGGGIFCAGASPRIRSCTISENRAGYGGGIFCVEGAAPTIAGCTVTDNAAEETGGGCCGYYRSSFTMVGCTLSRNSGGVRGGGIYLYDSNPELRSCVISENSAESGGGIYLCNLISSPFITNCTISGNSADGAAGVGGGICCDWGEFLFVTNTIIWGNTAVWFGPEYEEEIYGPAVVRYSVVEGGWPGIEMIHRDPLFVGAGDYHLSPASPCIDAGLAVGVYSDVDGELRPQGCGIDIGADENTVCYDCDGDHYPDEACGGGDCEDGNPIIHPDAVERCNNGTDDDCDGLTDAENPDCAGDFILDLNGLYEGGILFLAFTVGTPESSVWETSVILTVPAVQSIPLWSVPLEGIAPPMDLPVFFPFPSVGWVAIYTRLQTDGETGADEFIWVDTGDL